MCTGTNRRILKGTCNQVGGVCFGVIETRALIFGSWETIPPNLVQIYSLILGTNMRTNRQTIFRAPKYVS